jgi:general secretion pathway protein B
VSTVTGNAQPTKPPAGTPPAATGRPSADNAARPLAHTVVTPRRPPPPPDAGSGPIPLLSTLPAEFQDRLPPMEVNIHVYSPDAAQRILYINNRAYRQGDEVTGGAVVEEVVADGVVLYYDGQRFRLPRPR